MGFTGKNITTAIMDDGVDYMHPDLKYNFVSFGILKIRHKRTGNEKFFCIDYFTEQSTQICIKPKPCFRMQRLATILALMTHFHIQDIQMTGLTLTEHGKFVSQLFCLALGLRNSLNFRLCINSIDFL